MSRWKPFRFTTIFNKTKEINILYHVIYNELSILGFQLLHHPHGDAKKCYNNHFYVVKGSGRRVPLFSHSLSASDVLMQGWAFWNGRMMNDEGRRGPPFASVHFNSEGLMMNDGNLVDCLKVEGWRYQSEKKSTPLNDEWWRWRMLVWNVWWRMKDAFEGCFFWKYGLFYHYICTLHIN